MDPSEYPVEDLSGLTLTSRRPDHNLNSLYKPWYNRFPQRSRKGDTDYLCETCCHLDFNILCQRHSDSPTPADDYVKLGYFAEIKQETACKLCRMITNTVELVLAHNPSQIVKERARDDFTQCEWFMSPTMLCTPRGGHSYQLYLVPQVFRTAERGTTAHLHRNWPFALRLLGSSPGHGRRVPPDQVDFAWLKRTVDECDNLTEMPPREFRRQVRVIDVVDMCVVDLPNQARYITLSYPWGGLPQLELLTTNEAFLRQAGSIKETWEKLPCTIQDFLILVKEVKERYAWVDRMTILQDDPDGDQFEQMGQMGEIYRHSHFTIHAVSGCDANYGLPRVRPTPRVFKQLIVQISGHEMSNKLPWLDVEGYSNCGGAWGSRAWTYQERFMSQRSVFLGDFGIDINCWHTASPEDENCRHPNWHGRPKACGGIYFWDGQDPRCEPCITKHTPFDVYTQVVSEYTARELTYQKDALRAFLGVQGHFYDQFESDIVHGMPEAEFDAALLWSPISKHKQRLDPKTKMPLFPSWSWLGWEGSVAWPWQMERDTFVSMVNVPFLWRDALEPPPVPRRGTPDGTMYTMADGPVNCTYNPWFTSIDTCLPASPLRVQALQAIAEKTDDHLGVATECLRRRYEYRYANDPLVQWPHGGRPNLLHAHRLCPSITFRALITEFLVVGKPWPRKRLYNMRHTVYRMSVVDREGILAGYIDVPHPAEDGFSVQPGWHTFVVLSRSTINGCFSPLPDALHLQRKTPLSPLHLLLDEEFDLEAYEPKVTQLNEQGNFDGDTYSTIRPWCMFNIMMIEEYEQVAFRKAIGRVHVDAVLASNRGEPLPWEVVRLA